MNKVILTGRLAQEPDARYTNSGKAVTAFSVAVSRWVSGAEQTDFIPVVTWDKLAEACGNNLAKGRRVLVEGRLQLRSYETEGGEKRRVAEVVAERVEFLERAKAGKEQVDFGEMGEEVPY